MNSTVAPLFQDSDNCFTPIYWEGTSMEWRSIIGSPFCPLRPSTKHILTTLARYGDAMCNNIFPSQRELAFRAGVTTKCVCNSMKLAEKEGWIVRYEQGNRRGYKRHTYELCIPAGIFDLTTRMRSQFWKPPYTHWIVKRDNEYVLENRFGA